MKLLKPVMKPCYSKTTSKTSLGSPANFLHGVEMQPHSIGKQWQVQATDKGRVKVYNKGRVKVYNNCFPAKFENIS